MMMRKKEKIAVVLLFMALVSLAVAFWAFGSEEGEQESSSGSIFQKDASLSTEGLALKIKPTESGGNLLIKLDSTPLPIFIPSRAGAKGIRAGDRVKIRGTISVFQGNEELVFSRQADIHVLSA